jgi:Txe/YoeB family toxin of Txe-Axe toxin-antitoxin module
MEPKQLGPNGGMEFPAMPQPEQGEYRMPGNTAETSPERGFETRFERPAAVEQLAQPATPVPVLPTPVVAVQDDNATVSAVTDSSLLTAADEDLIEKEWVDKAKKIISETKDDPYRREQEVGKLQIEYIRKRYGREIGETAE